MSARVLHLFFAPMPLLLALASGPFSPADGQGPRSARHGLMASRPQPFRLSPVPRLSEYQLNSVHDRVTNQTRVSVQSFRRSAPVADGAFMTFSIAVNSPFQAPGATLDSVEVEFTGFAPLRRGWAFGSPRTLTAILDDSLRYEVPAADYFRAPLRLGDSRRSDVMRFRIPRSRFIVLTASTRLNLKVGRFTIKLDRYGLEALRAFSRKLGSSPQ